MEDIELLGSAARALGGEYKEHALGGHYLSFTPNGNGISWNPLTNDGDALRLAVDLGLHVKICRRMVLVEKREIGDDCMERLVPDARSATRRAIVRAAADLGKEQRPC